MGGVGYIVLALLILETLAGLYLPRRRSQVNFIGALIGAGASLIGGALNRKSQKKANAANSPAGQKAQYEAAEMNPVWGMSNHNYIPQVSTGIGDAFAKAGGIADDYFTQIELEKKEESKVRKQNTELRKQLDQIAREGPRSDFQRYQSVLPLPSQKPVLVSTVNPPDRSEAVEGTGVSSAPTVETVRPYDGYQPIVVANDTPTVVMRPDGLTAANSQDPTELEADFWNWSRNGTLIDNGLEVYDRNFGRTIFHYARDAHKGAQAWRDHKPTKGDAEYSRDHFEEPTAYRTGVPLRHRNK